MSRLHWWSLPGPRRFLDGVLERRAQHGIVAVETPAGLAGLVDAIAGRLREADGIRPEIVQGRDDSRSPAHLLGSRAHGARIGIRTVEDFLRAPELDGRTFIVHDIPVARWRRWQLFLGELRRLKLEPGLGPKIVTILPGGVRPDEVIGTFGGKALARWLGCVTRTDTEAWATEIAGPPSGLISRMARATTVELAGWNRSLLEALLRCEDIVQYDPRDILAAAAQDGIAGRAICWEDGLVDVWDDEVRVDTLALLASARAEEVTKRIWRAHIRVLFPFLDEIRTAIVRRHAATLSRLVSPESPWRRRPTVGFPDPPFRCNPLQLELSEIRMVARELIRRNMAQCEELLSEGEDTLCMKGNALRGSMAHLDPAPIADVQQIVDLWDQAEGWLPKEEAGWDWPRCGQTLTLMVGPPGAGKSTWAARNHPDGIVSADGVRSENPDYLERQVFAVARERVRKLLASGRNALLDAPNLDRTDRALSRSVAPAWIMVRYVVVDRPLADKLCDGTKRAPEQCGLIEEGHKAFAQVVGEALTGDGDASIVVVDAVRRDFDSKKAA